MRDASGKLLTTNRVSGQGNAIGGVRPYFFTPVFERTDDTLHVGLSGDYI